MADGPSQQETKLNITVAALTLVAFAPRGGRNASAPTRAKGSRLKFPNSWWRELECSYATLLVANADGFLRSISKDLSIANFAAGGVFDDCVDHGVDNLVV